MFAASAASTAAFTASAAFAASAASASALRLASNASLNAGRGFGRSPDAVGAGTAAAAIGLACGVDDGVGELAENENEGKPISISERGTPEGKSPKMEDVSGLLSLRLRRGGVLAGGTTAVRVAVDESFITSVRGKASELGGRAATLSPASPISPTSIISDEGEIRLATDGDDRRISLSMLDCSPSASIVSRLSEGGTEIPLAPGFLRARDSLTSAAAQ